MNNENQNININRNLKKSTTLLSLRQSIKNLKKIKIEFGEKNEHLINNKKFGNN